MGVIGNLMFAVGFKVTNRAVQKADKDLQKLRGSADKADISITGLGKGFQKLESVAVASLGGISLAFLSASAVTVAEDFERAMDKISGSTGATTAQMEETKGIAETLYDQNFGENWADLGKSISVTQQITKLQGDELESTTKKALLMRDVLDQDFNSSLKTAENLHKTFQGLSRDNAFNLIAQGIRGGLDASGELLDSANEYGTHFDSLGFNASEMFDVFSAGVESGAYSIDKVGDAIKEFNIRAKDDSKTTTDAFMMLGLNADEMMKTFAAGGPAARAAFIQVMQMINDIEDPLEKNIVSVNLMGTQYEDLQTIIGTFATGVKSQFDETINTMEELNQIKLNSVGEATMEFGRQVELLVLQPLGAMLIPAIMFLSDALRFTRDNIDILGPAFGAFALVIGVTVAPSLWAMAVAGWAAIAPWTPFIGIAIAVGAAVAGVIWAFKNWGEIMQWLDNVFYGINLFQAGADIINGLINGITSRAALAIQRAREIASGIANGIKDFLGIQSPSRLMMEVGFWTGEGLAEGIAGTEQRVSTASDDLATEAAAPFQNDGYLAPTITPSSSPASFRSSGQGGTTTLHLVVEVRGETPVSTESAGNIADQVKPVIQEVIESAMRRLGITPDVVVD